jgi:hypothetical protein
MSVGTPARVTSPQTGLITHVLESDTSVPRR